MQVDRTRHEQLLRNATRASVAVACSLFALKLGAWWFTDSLALLASTVDSGLDALASGLNLFAVRHALMPADDDHRFGHSKAEPLAGLAQALLIGGSGAFLIVRALGRIAQPPALEHTPEGIAVLLVALLGTALLVRYQAHVISLTHSTAVAADALHYRSDLLTNTGSLLALGLSRWFGWHLADPLICLVIACYIAFGALRIGREALDLLMDRELSLEDRLRIEAAVLEHARVLGLHDLRTRGSRAQPFVQFHLELDGALSLSEAHAITEEVAARLRREWPFAELIIRQDPQDSPDAVAERARLQHARKH